MLKSQETDLHRPAERLKPISPELEKRHDESAFKMSTYDEMLARTKAFIEQSPPFIANLIDTYGFDCVWNAQSQVASINDESGMRAACERLKKKYPL